MLDWRLLFVGQYLLIAGKSSLPSGGNFRAAT
jgi:hypothetical protein